MTRHEFTDSIFRNLNSPVSIDFHHFTYGTNDDNIGRMVTIHFETLALHEIDKIRDEIYSLNQWGWVFVHDEEFGIGIASSSWDADFFAGLKMNAHTIIYREEWEKENKDTE